MTMAITMTMTNTAMYTPIKVDHVDFFFSSSLCTFLSFLSKAKVMDFPSPRRQIKLNLL